VQSCLVDLGETTESVVSDILSREKYECIMVGAGIRILPQNTVMFKKILNTSHQKAQHLLQKYASILIPVTLLRQSSVG